MRIDDDRQEFEKFFEIPEGVYWSKYSGYTAKSPTMDWEKAKELNAQLAGWIAATVHYGAN